MTESMCNIIHQNGQCCFRDDFNQSPPLIIFVECFVLDRICENINSIIKFLFGGLKNLLNIFNATTSWELIEN